MTQNRKHNRLPLVSSTRNLAFDFIEEIRSIEDADQAQAAFENAISSFGFTNFMCGDVLNPRASGFVVGNWNRQWAERFYEQNYLRHDPVVLRNFRDNAPFFWHDERPLVEGLQARIMDEGREFGMFDGFCIPIHGPGSRTSAVSMAAKAIEMSHEDIRALHMMCMCFHGRMEYLMRHAARIAPGILTERETECLKWATLGKTDWEIGRILSISERTVRQHFTNIYRKLPACNRTHAVAIGIQWKLVVI